MSDRMPAEPYKVYAIRYAHLDRPARDNFIFGDVHDGPMPLDFFIWAIIGNGRTFVVDLGFDHSGAERRGRSIMRLPSEGLQMLGIDANKVEDVIVTHLHYDHAGDLSAFPNAKIYLQDREMAFATGRHMGHQRMRQVFDVEYVCHFVRAVYDDRVVFIDGAQEIVPGISVHHIGGHTDGHQSVRVWTERGWLVLASDAVHFYANMTEQNPFPIVYDVGAMIEGYGTIRGLADAEDLIIPGHDPLVVERFPCPDKTFQGEIVRLDRGPAGS